MAGSLGWRPHRKPRGQQRRDSGYNWNNFELVKGPFSLQLVYLILAHTLPYIERGAYFVNSPEDSFIDTKRIYAIESLIVPV